MMETRLDIAFAVSRAPRAMDKRNEAEWIDVKQILKYLWGTTVCCDAADISKTVLEAFRKRCSTSGGVAVCRQCNCMIKPTATVSGISTEAEFITASEGPKSCFG